MDVLKKQEQIPQAPAIEKDKEVVIEEQNTNLENGMQKYHFRDWWIFDDDLNHALDVLKKITKSQKIWWI